MPVSPTSPDRASRQTASESVNGSALPSGPLIRSETTVVLSSPNEVQVRTRRKPQAIRARGIGTLHDALFEAFDGTHTARDILRNVPSSHQATVTSYIQHLLEHGAISEQRSESVPAEPPVSVYRTPTVRGWAESPSIFVLSPSDAASLLTRLDEFLRSPYATRILVDLTSGASAQPFVDACVAQCGQQVRGTQDPLSVYLLRSQPRRMERVFSVPGPFSESDAEETYENIRQHLGIALPSMRRQLPISSMESRGSLFGSVPHYGLNLGDVQEHLQLAALVPNAAPHQREACAPVSLANGAEVRQRLQSAPEVSPLDDSAHWGDPDPSRPHALRKRVALPPAATCDAMVKQAYDAWIANASLDWRSVGTVTMPDKVVGSRMTYLADTLGDIAFVAQIQKEVADVPGLTSPAIRLTDRRAAGNSVEMSWDEPTALRRLLLRRVLDRVDLGPESVEPRIHERPLPSASLPLESKQTRKGAPSRSIERQTATLHLERVGLWGRTVFSGYLT